MFLLILESLGSTELVFILIMALVFFGPRKLPQISRSLGKNLAEFRRASDEFKRTWDREVTLEEGLGGSPILDQSSILDPETANHSVSAPTIVAVPADQGIARQANGAEPVHAFANTDLVSERPDFDSVTDQPKHSPKNDWL
ncbi:MAG: twin-arginine translocase TatA/TatE family subunit [Acidobacteriota bacterium]